MKSHKIEHLFFLLVLISTFIGTSKYLQVDATYNSSVNEDLIESYVISNAIGIYQNSHFVDLGFPGNGSESNPYIIENLKIVSDANTGIYVGSTTKYFIIRDCYIDTYAYGIRIESVAEGTATLYNNTIKNMKGAIGIFVEEASNITITENTCENVYHGLDVEDCESSTISNNEFRFNNIPMSISYCPNSFIFNNSVEFGSASGIHVGVSNNTVIANNTILNIGSSSRTRQGGIEVDYSRNITAFGNRIEDCGYGLDYFGVLDSETYSNIIMRCSSYGIYVDWYVTSWPSQNNTFHDNYFIANSWYYSYRENPNSQALDRGLEEHWYENTVNVGNYWSDYEGTGVYELDGGRGYYDPCPIGLEDTDGDGLDDIEEVYAYYTNPLKNDTDRDMLLDGEEILIYGTNPLKIDTDYDGLTDGEEILIYTTQPTTQDTDTDELKDGEEVLIYGTNPKTKDTDKDGLPDGWEVIWGLNPLVVDDDEDPDDDGLINSEEYEEETEPLSADTDEDFLIDGDEVHIYLTSPLNNDTDDDNALDGVEVHDYGCDPRVKDTDGDQLNDGREINVFFTNPCVKDTDGDSCEDGWEVKYKLNPLDASDANEDPDDDGLTNAEEFFYGTNPIKWDTDEDEFSDGHEVRAGTDPLLITDHPMPRADVIKMGVGIGLASALVVGIIVYVLIKKKIIFFKKK